MASPRTKLKMVAPAMLAAMAMAACGSSATGAEDSNAVGNPDGSLTTTTTEGSGSSSGDGGSSSGGSSSSGPATGTIEVADGTTYEFTTSTCKTNESDPDSFAVEPGYQVFGQTDDGVMLTLTRAGFSEDSAIESGNLGEDSGFGYVLDGLADLEVDGGNVSGTISMKSTSRVEPPHGEETTATVDFTC